MSNLINKIKNRKGFTLVELLVVLAVLAIISAIAIPRFAGVQDSAKKKADIETINVVQKALELLVVSEELSTTADKGVALAEFKDGVFSLSKETGFTDYETKAALYLDSIKVTLNDKTKDLIFTLNKDGSVTHP